MVANSNKPNAPGAIEVAREFFALAKQDECRDFTTFKLQKLLYRAQSLCQFERATDLFYESVKAWENGPVVPSVFQATKGLRIVPFSHASLSQPANLSESDRELIHAVWVRYKHLSGEEMADETHEEEAYQRARAKVTAFHRSPTIDPADMRAEVEKDRARQRSLIEAFVSGLVAGQSSKSR